MGASNKQAGPIRPESVRVFSYNDLGATIPNIAPSALKFRMNRGGSAPTIHRPPWQHQFVIGLLPLILGIERLASVIFVPMAIRGNADFRAFYSGGHLLRSDRGNLYNLERQKATEDSVVSRYPEANPSNHPAYEYSFIIPLTFLSYRVAFALWTLVSVGVIAICAWKLSGRLPRSVLICLFLGFSPVWGTLAQVKIQHGCCYSSCLRRQGAEI